MYVHICILSYTITIHFSSRMVAISCRALLQGALEKVAAATGGSKALTSEPQYLLRFSKWQVLRLVRFQRLACLDFEIDCLFCTTAEFC